MLCPVELANIKYSGVDPSPSPPPPPSASSELPAWAVIVMVAFALLFVIFLIVFCVMYGREKQGKPIFVKMSDVKGTNTGGGVEQTSASRA